MTYVIHPKMTLSGLSAAFNADNNGLELKISHVAFGDANGTGYTPSSAATSLVNELARVRISNQSRRVGDLQIEIQALLEQSPLDGKDVWEIGIYTEDGTLLAIWSDPVTKLFYKNQNTDLITKFSLFLAEIPAGSVNVNLSGPSVNILFDREMLSLTASALFSHNAEMRSLLASAAC